MNLKKIKKSKFILTSLLVLVLALSSCSKEDKGAKDDTTSLELAPIFEGKDIFGNEVPMDYYAKNELTMVNLFATTCNPCMNEMPEVMALAEELKDEGFGVLAISSDFGADGNLDPEAEEIMKELFVESKENFKVMYPDFDLTLDVLAKANNTIPYTFFVDKEGKIVGDTYLGAKSGDEWKEIIKSNMGK